MVTSGANEIKLVLSVDRADIERQLSKGFDATIGKPLATGGGEGSGAKGKPTKVNPGKSFVRALAPLAALFGISLTIGGLLKQSKIMQTTASAFGQILGAMIDMLLMPFMPLIVDMLRGLIGMLPGINKWAKEVLVPAVNKLRENITAWWDDNGENLKNIVTTLWDILGPFVGFAWDQFFINIGRIAFLLGGLLTGINSIVEFIKSIKLPGWMLNKEGGSALTAEGSGGLLGSSKDYESKYTIQKTAIAAFKGIQNIINISIDKEGRATVEDGGSTSANMIARQQPGSPP